MDKFLIPLVDKLLDELHDAKFFTKLNLHNGYHQVCMVPEDVEKMTFYTHHSHFELLVMPFDLTDAPLAFQALMNAILKSYSLVEDVVCWFVPVFFMIANQHEEDACVGLCLCFL